MREERRKDIRVRARLTVSFNVRGVKKEHTVLTRDVGGMGLSFVTEENVSVGDELIVRLKLPDNTDTFIFRVEVVWTRPSLEGLKTYQEPNVRVGVKFTQIEPKERDMIVQYARMNALPE